MKHSLRFIFSILMITALSACSKSFEGTWNVERYEILTPGNESAVLSNIGHFEFQKEGLGQKSLRYSLLGASKEDTTAFRWRLDKEEYITIQGEGSEFSKTWIIITNKDNYQKWKTTDGANNVQILELKR